MGPGRILSQPKQRHPAARTRRAFVAGSVVSFFVGVGAFGTAKDPNAVPRRVTVVEALSVPLAQDATKGKQVYWHETRFERTDTIASMLGRLGVGGADSAKLLTENGTAKPFRYLKPGVIAQAQTTDAGALLSLSVLPLDEETVLGFERDGEQFRTIEKRPHLTRQVTLKSGEIYGSLFAAADDVGLPDSVTTQIAEIFSGDVDFQRDLQRGDRIAVIYEVYYHDGRPLRAGRVLAAELVNGRKTYRAIWFADETGRSGYYTPEGKSLRRAFLRSPLEFSRITSGFAERFHPILRQWRAHQGVDYGAPTGTRVKATADGTVEFMGVQNGYGNVVVLRHGGAITTLYAHLSRFAAGVRKGARVSQGDAIGYVGATGWATGPHLHYEFRVYDEHRDPLRIRMPAADPVPARFMATFREEARPLAEQLDLFADLTVASLD